MLFQVLFEKGILAFFEENFFLGDAFGDIVNSIEGFACFRLKHATIVVKG
jgi:hypothetical protein